MYDRAGRRRAQNETAIKLEVYFNTAPRRRPNRPNWNRTCEFRDGGWDRNVATENDFNDRLESFLRVVTTLLLHFSMKRVY